MVSSCNSGTTRPERGERPSRSMTSTICSTTTQALPHQSRVMKDRIASTSSTAWSVQTIEITAPVGHPARGGALLHRLRLGQGPARPSRGSKGARSRLRKWHLPEDSGRPRESCPLDRRESCAPFPPHRGSNIAWPRDQTMLYMNGSGADLWWQRRLFVGACRVSSSEKGWCRGTESNRRHGDFQSPALPPELPRHSAARPRHSIAQTFSAAQGWAARRPRSATSGGDETSLTG